MEARSFTALPIFTPRKINSPRAFNLQNSSRKNPNFPLQAWTERLSPFSAVNAEYLEREFGGHGAAFEPLGDDCVIKMELEEGSTANMMLPRGLITSYKPKMWHGGRVEVIHTLVSEEGNGEVLIQGGVSLDVECVADSGLIQWSPATWALQDVRGASDTFIQVELISTHPNEKMEAKYLVTLREDLISSELIITNLTTSLVQLEGSVMSHLTVSTPDATYALGLQGSRYYNKQVSSEFSINPPAHLAKGKSSPGLFKTLARKGFDVLFDGWGMKKHNGEADEEEEEEDEKVLEKEERSDYAQMDEKFSRVYASAPMEFTVIDRGRRNSVMVRRSGFEEVYMFSPGSDYEWYGKYAFVCVAPCASLKPILLGPGQVWKGAQHLHNPNI